MALNGNAGFKVPTVESWFETKELWEFDITKSAIQKHPVEIKEMMSEDLDLFYSV
jgi:hypothetical protein